MFPRSVVKKRPGKVRMPRCPTGADQKLGEELFFLVVAGLEDLMTEAETVYEAEKCIGERTHRREDSGSM